MEHTTLGKTGISVSRICLGTMTFGPILAEKEASEIVDKAIEFGINFFDTANVYGGGQSEEMLGAAIKGRRDEVVIASKVFWSPTRSQSGLSRAFVLNELNDSLDRLQTDYIDLYYAHRYDVDTSAENFVRTFNHAIGEGKIRHIGASSMYAWELVKTLWAADKLGLEPVQVIQPQYNLLFREEEREILPLCKDQDIAVVPWAPFAQGVLAGKYTRDSLSDSPRAQNENIQHWFLREEDFTILDRVIEVAEQRDVTPAQIALAWTLAKNVVSSPIIGVSKMAHLEQAVEAVEIKLTQEECTYLEELYQPRALIGHFHGEAMDGDPQEE